MATLGELKRMAAVTRRTIKYNQTHRERCISHNLVIKNGVLDQDRFFDDPYRTVGWSYDTKRYDDCDTTIGFWEFPGARQISCCCNCSCVKMKDNNHDCKGNIIHYPESHMLQTYIGDKDFTVAFDVDNEVVFFENMKETAKDVSDDIYEFVSGFTDKKVFHGEAAGVKFTMKYVAPFIYSFEMNYKGDRYFVVLGIYMTIGDLSFGVNTLSKIYTKKDFNRIYRKTIIRHFHMWHDRTIIDIDDESTCLLYSVVVFKSILKIKYGINDVFNHIFGCIEDVVDFANERLGYKKFVIKEGRTES